MSDDRHPSLKLGTSLPHLAEIISSKYPEMGFALVVFEFGDQGALNYISNANPRDMAAQFRRIANRLEQNGSDSTTPSH